MIHTELQGILLIHFTLPPGKAIRSMMVQAIHSATATRLANIAIRITPP
jgi:hypothetical protein